MSLIATLLAALALLSTPDASQLQHTAAALEAEASTRAELLAASPGAPAEALPAGDPVLEGLDALSLAAARHARAIDAAGGARDLACIFRGMSADAAAWPEQLAGMDRAADQARAYREIARLANHAARLAQEDIRSAAPA
ncbi:hypothetical protein L2D01_01095 [Hyphomonadaceae bacterium ML37]|nr:hypothetical protein L2D01_01095 [Hyphomonadaceae bacterium ML37]